MQQADVFSIVNLVALVLQASALFYWGGRLSERQKINTETLRDHAGRLRALEDPAHPVTRRLRRTEEPL